MHLSARTARLLFWTGDRLLRFGAASLALLAALVLLTVHQSAWKRDGVDRAWVPDAAHLDLAVAGQVAAGHGYRLDDPDGMPVQARALWRGLVGALARLNGDPAATAQGLSALCAATLLVVLFRAVRSSTGSTPAAAGAALAVAVSAPFLLLASSPEPHALAALLVALAADLHLRSLDDDGRPLALMMALPIGLALLVRVEFAGLWLILVLHALLDAVVERRGGERLALCGWNAVAGVLLLAVCLWPLVNLNVRLFGNPWPAAAAPLGASALDGWRLLVTDGPRSGPVEFLVVLAGLAALIAPAGARAGFRLALLPLLAVLAPLLAALPSFSLGAGGPDLVVNALRPLLLAFAVAGPLLLAGRLAGKAAAPARGALALVLVGALGARGFAASGAESAARRAAEDRREEVALQLGVADAPAAQPVGTDQPGWLRWKKRQPVVDLSAQTSINLLRALSAAGKLDPLKTRTEVALLQPSGLAIWDPAREPLLDRLDALPWQTRWQSDDGWPRVRK